MTKQTIILEAPKDPKDLPAWFYNLCTRFENPNVSLCDFKDGVGYYKVEHSGEKNEHPSN